MLDENVAIVRSLFEPFDGVNLAAIDWTAEASREAIGRAYSPDIELRTLASGLGSGVAEFYRGVDGLSRYLGEWLEPFTEYHADNLDYIEAGDCVLASHDGMTIEAGEILDAGDGFPRDDCAEPSPRRWCLGRGTLVAGFDLSRARNRQGRGVS